MKTPSFHYEAQKNTELLKSKGQWQDMLDYRSMLLHQSKKFQKKYTAANFQA